MTAITDSGAAGEVKFGLGQLTNESPIWAKWIFRSYFIISKAAIGWLGAVNILSTHDLFVTTTTISLLLDPIVLGFSNLFGVQTDGSNVKSPG